MSFAHDEHVFTTDSGLQAELESQGCLPVGVVQHTSAGGEVRVDFYAIDTMEPTEGRTCREHNLRLAQPEDAQQFEREPPRAFQNFLAWTFAVVVISADLSAETYFPRRPASTIQTATSGHFFFPGMGRAEAVDLLGVLKAIGIAHSARFRTDENRQIEIRKWSQAGGDERRFEQL